MSNCQQMSKVTTQPKEQQSRLYVLSNLYEY